MGAYASMNTCGTVLVARRYIAASAGRSGEMSGVILIGVIPIMELSLKLLVGLLRFLAIKIKGWCYSD